MKKIIPYNILLLLIFGAALRAAVSAVPARPNVIFILADDLGSADLGCYGGKAIATPNLDQFAAEGLRFTQAYAGSPVCAPSRCALFTGLHSGHAPVRGNLPGGPESDWPLPAKTPTLTGMLKSAGYATGVFGKWGLGGPGTTGEPARHGVDLFFGYLSQRLAHEYYPPMLRRNAEAVAQDGRTYSHEVIFSEALAFVRAHRERPFFVHLAITLPHGKLDVPDASAYADRPWPQLIKNYAAMVSLLDRDVGRLLALLRELSLEENTVVFFASDNGAEVFYFKPPSAGSDLVPDYIAALRSNGSLRGFKRDLYEGGIRVPLLARWPGKIRTGVSAHVCAFWDVLPTVAELCGVPAPSGIDGLSFAPTLLGRSDAQRVHPHLYWEFHEGGFAQAVHFRDWKAVRRGSDAPIELYSLKDDMLEQYNRAPDEPALVREANALMQSSRTENAAFVPKPGVIRGSGYAGTP